MSTRGPIEANGLQASGLHKSFASQRVLTGVDLEIPPGSFTAILGPSGSGKTTLLRIFAGLERPDAGTVTIGGSVVEDSSRLHVPAERRRLGYVSQEGSLFPHLNVEANVGFGLHRRQRRGVRVRELLEAVGLSGLGRRYPHQLSGGQQQRVALARALAVSPGAVLLDEPFASLDAQLRVAMRSDVGEILRGAGTTGVLVTHDQDEALSMADYVAVIRRGRIAQLGTPAELYAHPADAELARFVGAANLLPGRRGDGVVETPLGPAEAPGVSGVTGDAVTVLVRPEQLRIAALDISCQDAGDGGVPGRVVSTSYHGHDCLVAVQPDGRAGGQTGRVVARTLGDPHLGDGAAVTLSITGPVLTFPPEAPVGPDGEAETPGDAGR